MDIFDGLSESQREAVAVIDEDLEIIACAGAGKTGVVTRRIINILKSKPDVSPENIVAFTFTKKAAEELKGRISAYGKFVLGHTKGFTHMYVGTIHSFCIRMLQNYIPEFQKFTVLDEIQTKLFVERYYEECGMQDLELKKYIETSLFITVMSVLNENWFEQDKWDEKTRVAFEKYQKKMYEEKKFDYSLILKEMINQLETNHKFAEIIKNKVKYLTVDEYQDTNPVQDQLINILKKFGANICVVGDDDQTIYQFRGSDPQNILTFKERYGIKKYIVLDKNYRSTNGIVDVARRVIVNNDMRLPKTMTSGCTTKYDIGDLAYEEHPDIEDEFEFIARRIIKLHEIGIPYSEIAILLRKRKVSGKVAEILEEYDIPFVVEGVNDLFGTKECKAARGIYEYLNGDIPATELFERWLEIDYPLDKKEVADALQYLATIDVKEIKLYSEFNIQAIYHEFLRRVSIVEDGKAETEILMYNLGKFSQVIADYEIINYTLKPRTKLNNFCLFLKYTASQYYPEGYLTNSYAKLDAVSIMTVHQSKGLEFAAVFIPQLNRNFFPAQRVGGKGIWHVIDKSWITNAERFDGDIEEERKLFYVAVTRAKKYLYLTRSETSHDKYISPFLEEAKESSYLVKYDGNIQYVSGNIPSVKQESMPISLNFSLLEDYFDCPYRFKLSMFYGFEQPIVPALGYGNVLHEIVKNIHIAALNGESLTKDDVKRIIDESFYLLYATPKLEENMYKSVTRAINNYVEHNRDEMKNVHMTEADIEIDMGDGIKVNGRIDLVKKITSRDNEQIAIVDFKTANKEVVESINKEQLKIYALGYQELTGEMADYMEVYHLDSEKSIKESVTETVIQEVRKEITDAAVNIRNNHLPRKCNKENCSKCHLSHLCLSKTEKKQYAR